MVQLSEEQKQNIIKKLQDRGAVLPCPRCGNQSFTLLDGYFSDSLQIKMGVMVLGGPTVPSVVTACQRCGFMAQHALGSLGLLPQEGGQR